MTMIYNLEMCFDTEDMDTKDIGMLYRATDQIFSKWNIVCTMNQGNKRIYQIAEDEDGFVKLWGALFMVKDNEWLTKHISECSYLNTCGQLQDVANAFLKD